MGIRKSRKLDVHTLSPRPLTISSTDVFVNRRHAPRSVCDTERDRLQNKNPMTEEELQ